jgi:non-homologous end joining protein Ku
MSKNTIKIDELFKLLSDVASDSKFEIIQTLKEPFMSNPNALIWLTEMTSATSSEEFANKSKVAELIKTEIEKNPDFAKTIKDLFEKLKAEIEAKNKAKKEEEKEVTEEATSKDL